jgi:hypothetical protein
MMKHVRRNASRFGIGSAAIMALALTGCAFDERNPSPATLQDKLESRWLMLLTPSASAVQVNGQNIGITGGQVVVHTPTPGFITIDQLTVELGDAVVQEGSAIDGTVLTRLRATLVDDASAPVEWSLAGDSATAEIDLDMQLDWAMVAQNGLVVDLAPQRIANVHLSLHVWQAADGTLVAELTGGLDGQFFNWADLLDMHDLRVSLHAEAWDAGEGDVHSGPGTEVVE